MVKDRNKGISNITYNHLNLPTEIKFEGTTNKITYLYNAAGQKLKKTVVYSDSIKIVDYLDGFQYAGGELNFFPHPEGYVSVKRGGRTAPDGSQGYVFNYVFNYTDHLDERNQSIALIEVCERSSVRVSYSKDPQTHQLKILEENHYYPFGLKHSVYTAGRLRDFEVDSSNPEGEHVFLTPVTKTDYQYKYNGQEWQDELGLNMYAMDLRQYDPAIGRWVAQDPVTHFDYSPYSAFDNNPVFWADPSGADAVNIGYDRTIDSQDMMGSYHWSGGFQEIENEGGTGEKGESAKSQTGLGKIFSKIGKGIRSVFGGRPKYTVDTSGMTWDIMPEQPPTFGETETVTTSYSIQENLFWDLNFRDSNVISGTKGQINTDTETIIDVNNPNNSLIRNNYQLITPGFKASAFGGINKPVIGVSLEQSFFGLGGVSGVINADISRLQHSSLSIRISENINLNSNSKSIGIGIKPLGALILILSRGTVMSRTPVPAVP